MTAAEQIEYRDILYHYEDGVAWVTMNRPEKRNALSQRHMEELIDCFTQIGGDPVGEGGHLEGNGPAFCSGHDLGEMAGADAAFYQMLFDTCTPTDGDYPTDPQPVIAEFTESLLRPVASWRRRAIWSSPRRKLRLLRPASASGSFVRRRWSL